MLCFLKAQDDLKFTNRFSLAFLNALAHRNRSDFCDLRLRCPSRTPEIASDFRDIALRFELRFPGPKPFFLWDFWRFGSVNAEIASDCDCAILVRYAQRKVSRQICKKNLQSSLEGRQGNLLWQKGKSYVWVMFCGLIIRWPCGVHHFFFFPLQPLAADPMSRSWKALATSKENPSNGPPAPKTFLSGLFLLESTWELQNNRSVVHMAVQTENIFF